MNELSRQIYGEEFEPQDSMDSTFLNRCPDVMKGDLRRAGEVILGTRNQPIVRAFVDKTGMYQNPRDGDIQFYGNGQVECRDIDILKNALLMAGHKEKDFRGSIDRLRQQYAGLYYYHLKLLDFDENERLEGGIKMVREMNNCGRYPVRIFQDRSMMDFLLSSARDFKEMRKVFNFMASNKYEDEEGVERLVCEPDDEMFDLWLEKCRNAKHFKKMHQMLMRLVSDYDIPADSWYSECKESEDFAYFIGHAIQGNIKFRVDLCHLLDWFESIRTYQQMNVFMECLMKLDIEPDARLFSLIAHKYGLKETGGIGREEFRVRFRELYSSPESSKRVTSPAMTRVHELVTARL